MTITENTVTENTATKNIATKNTATERSVATTHHAVAEELRDLDARSTPTSTPPGPRRRHLFTGLVVVAGLAAVAAVSIQTLDRGQTTDQQIDSPTGRVPSGSPFDAPLVGSRTGRVPSGSPFDAPLVVGSRTGRVPSGSPFDAPLVVGSRTGRVPSGSPFDAPLAAG